MENFPDYLALPANELARIAKIRLEILPDLPALYQHFARSIADEIKENNRHGEPTRLILPVGPLGQFPILAEISNRERISWKNVFTFNMDEYCDWQGRAVPVTHPLSFRGYIYKNLFDCLDAEIRIPDDHIHFPDPLNLDRISERIQVVGGVDTCYGGIGYHGHVAFNEAPISRWYKLSPDEFRNSLTRLVSLEPETIVMNSIRSTGGNPAAMPPMAVTLGMKDIYSARRIRLYCQGGSWQRTVLRIAVLGEETVEYPVTLLQKHTDIAILTDENTAVSPMPQANA
ncbi:MAG: glucosamine-6-phosphate isomerase [Chloroflexota bacterium]|nr:MAG: glucosamine-6-phosphate isomerase [Chloroflexota bacterium]